MLSSIQHLGSLVEWWRVPQNLGGSGLSVRTSLVLMACLNPLIGHEQTPQFVKEAFKTGKTIREIFQEQAILPQDELDKALDLQRMTELQA